MKNKQIIKKRELVVIFIIIITLLLFFSGYSIGKVKQNTNIKANAQIAEPILIVENEPTIQVDGSNEKQYYNFKVKNENEDGKINQVDLEYNIEILTDKQDGISFNLYKDDVKIPLENNKTDNIIMKKEKLQQDNYKLEITYDKSKNTTNKDILQDVQIKVHSEQMKQKKEA